jgi:hypothetical protein
LAALIEHQAMVIVIIEEKTGEGCRQGENWQPPSSRPTPHISRPFPKTLLHFSHADFVVRCYG